MADATCAPANEQCDVSEQKQVRLGRLPMKSTMKALQFADFFQFVQLPKAQTYWRKKPALPLRTFGNTQYGCCTRAKQAVAAMRMERLEQRGKTIDITDAEVIRVYQDMSNRLYGGGDNGAYEDDALKEWRNRDTTFRDVDEHPYAIDAYLRLNAKNVNELKAGLALAGAKGIAICMDLPRAFASIDPPTPWGLPAAGVPLVGDLVPGSWGGHCCAGDTPIPLLNGETVPLADLVGQENIWVYGALSSSQPIPAMARTVERTRRAATLRVHIDDETSLRTTPEHRWMMRDGSYKRADALQPGDRLMPLRRITHHRGYEKVKWYDGAKKQAFTHRLVAEMLGADSPAIVTHHLDENKRNNDPSNIALGSQSDHVRIHRPWETSSTTGGHGWFATPEGRAYAQRMAAARQRTDAGQFAPASTNHKVVAIERCGEEWVYDLIGVNPTSNFAAGSVFVHNSMWCNGFTKDGLIVDDTWAMPNRLITWDAVAAYLDEAHLVIDSIDAWRKKAVSRKGRQALGDIVDAVNAVSAIRIAA